MASGARGEGTWQIEEGERAREREREREREEDSLGRVKIIIIVKAYREINWKLRTRPKVNTCCVREYGRQPTSAAAEGGEPAALIICLNSLKLTIPSPSTSTLRIICRQSSTVRPCLRPSEASTDRSSSTVMKPSPFWSNTLKASRMSSSSAPNSSMSTQPSPLASIFSIIVIRSFSGMWMPRFCSESLSSLFVILPSPLRSNIWNTRFSSAASIAGRRFFFCFFFSGAGGGGGGGGGERGRTGRWEEKNVRSLLSALGPDFSIRSSHLVFHQLARRGRQIPRSRNEHSGSPLVCDSRSIHTLFSG
ncbi:unnamed protein product [Spirodela intermedia]|uniref:Uncharacterized protein n=1 Tax=Spirodela intermedia TaxID=51605 RepID=A0A7I8IQC8_SPIIN|nr:unnamed protein product [Spirodela intermedia]CAA6660140.1 unnamed protein product [Spirodela intermedia]